MAVGPAVAEAAAVGPVAVAAEAVALDPEGFEQPVLRLDVVLEDDHP